MTTIVSVLQT